MELELNIYKSNFSLILAFFLFSVINCADGFAGQEYSNNSVLVIQIPFSMINKGAHRTVSGPLMNRWQKLMLLDIRSPIKLW